MKLLLILLLITSCRNKGPKSLPIRYVSSCKEGEILRTDGKEFRCVTKQEYRNELF